MKKVLFIDTVHPYLWQELQKEGYSCFEGYDLSQKAIIEQHNDCLLYTSDAADES